MRPEPLASRIMRPREGRRHAGTTIVYRRIQGETGLGGVRAGRRKSAPPACAASTKSCRTCSRGKTEFVTRTAAVFVGNHTRDQQAESRIADLERMVERLTVELEVARKAVLLSTSHSASRYRE